MNPMQAWFSEVDGVINELSSWVDSNKLSIERRQVLAQACDLLSRAQLVLGESITAQLNWLQLDGEYGTDGEAATD